jgi:hypothetical protein
MELVAPAERLTLSPKTVSNHISNIFSKLQVADRAQAIIRAREAGLGTADRVNSADTIIRAREAGSGHESH